MKSLQMALEYFNKAIEIGTKAMDWFEKGYENHDANIPYIGLNTFSQGLFKIDNPRYYELLKKMNLPLPVE